MTTGELTHGAPSLAPPGAPPSVHLEERRGRVRRARAWLRSERGRTFGTFALLALVLAAITPAESAYDGPMRLARELASGRTYLPEFVPWIEMFRHDGRDYLAYPPMVSFLLVPFAWASRGALGQPPVNSILIFGSAFLLYRFVRSLDGIARFARLAAVVYVLGTPVIYSAYSGNVWLLMHSEGNFFFLLSLLLALTYDRWFWAGLTFMFAAQVRYVVVLAGVVFALELVRQARERRSVAHAVRRAIPFAAAACLPLAMTAAYQWRTLGDPLLSPYMVGWAQWGQRTPAFSLGHIWNNWPVYTYLHPTLTASFPFVRFDPAGQSIFTMSPFFLGIFFLDWRRIFVRLFLPAVLLMQCFYLFYYWSGYSQYGARYMQDLYPLLVPIALSAFARPGKIARTMLPALVAYALALNVYGAWVMMYYPP